MQWIRHDSLAIHSSNHVYCMILGLLHNHLFALFHLLFGIQIFGILFTISIRLVWYGSISLTTRSSRLFVHPVGLASFTHGRLVKCWLLVRMVRFFWPCVGRSTSSCHTWHSAILKLVVTSLGSHGQVFSGGWLLLAFDQVSWVCLGSRPDWLGRKATE